MPSAPRTPLSSPPTPPPPHPTPSAWPEAPRKLPCAVASAGFPSTSSWNVVRKNPEVSAFSGQEWRANRQVPSRLRTFSEAVGSSRLVLRDDVSRYRWGRTGESLVLICGRFLPPRRAEARRASMYACKFVRPGCKCSFVGLTTNNVGADGHVATETHV